MHDCRFTSLLDVVESLVYGQTLTVTGLGRSSLRDISMKHSIKQSDRLIGNGHLYQERQSIYQAIAKDIASRVYAGHCNRCWIYRAMVSDRRKNGLELYWAFAEKFVVSRRGVRRLAEMQRLV